MSGTLPGLSLFEGWLSCTFKKKTHKQNHIQRCSHSKLPLSVCCFLFNTAKSKPELSLTFIIFSVVLFFFFLECVWVIISLSLKYKNFRAIFLGVDLFPFFLPSAWWALLIWRCRGFFFLSPSSEAVSLNSAMSPCALILHSVTRVFQSAEAPLSVPWRCPYLSWVLVSDHFCPLLSGMLKFTSIWQPENRLHGSKQASILPSSSSWQLGLLLT